VGIALGSPTLGASPWLANILAEVIVELAPALHAHTAPGGLLVASGIILRKEAEVAAALVAAGFDLPTRTQEGDWVGLVARRS
jgi:ribosomal protein L11 methyltransferase